MEEYQHLHLFDMGLAKLYLDPSTGEHMPFREGRGGVGTPRYISHNVHFGLGAHFLCDLQRFRYH
jgi:hypothetical protein